MIPGDNITNFFLFHQKKINIEVQKEFKSDLKKRYEQEEFFEGGYGWGCLSCLQDSAHCCERCAMAGIAPLRQASCDGCCLALQLNQAVELPA